MRAGWWTMLSIWQINHNHQLSSQLKHNLRLWDGLLICHIFSSSFSREHYFASAAWVSQTEVSVVWMNRAQNLSVVTLCKSPMWYCQEVREMAFKCLCFSIRHFLKTKIEFSIYWFLWTCVSLLLTQTHKTSGDGRGWVDELSIPYFSANVSSYIAISPVREGNSGMQKNHS